ncbi:MAG: Serine phosphatase RsbU, regulator of sigma subunit, partial [Candidatus Krumholzibacteriota bacterium]|nr:Serine phosphatase RsbU, regulator of sigma subunit [Candidatus Krumholzibacteriota bacterium]
NSTLDFESLVALIMKIVKEALNVETVAILTYDKDKKNMIFEVARGKDRKDIQGLKIPVGLGVVGWVAEKRRPVVINDVRNDPRYSRELEKKYGLKPRSIMSIPLKHGNRLIGVLEAVNRRGSTAFTNEDLKIFLALGNHIAAAIENARLFRDAERKRLENALLYDVSMSLGKPLALVDVLREILASLKKLIPYDAAAIFVVNRKNQQLESEVHTGYTPEDKEERLRLKLDEGLVGWAASHKTGVICPDCTQDPRYVNAREKTRSEMVAPMLSGGRVIGIFNLESNATNAYSEEGLRLLQAFAAQAGVSIERARLYEEQQGKREIERELRLARTVQQFFTPLQSRRLGPFTIAGRNYPSLELSGDCFDFFPLKEPFSAFAIADVAGKGVPASIIMSSFRACLHTVAPYFTRARDIAQRANEILLETVRPHDFVTAFIGVLNHQTGEVTYCNAGHNPAVLMKADGKHELLETGGTILGVFPDLELHQGRFLLEDSLLLCYTDGTIDAVNAKDEPFGMERLVEFARKHREFGAARICTALRARLREHVQNMPQVDDMTFLVLKR